MKITLEKRDVDRKAVGTRNRQQVSDDVYDVKVDGEQAGVLFTQSPRLIAGLAGLHREGAPRDTVVLK